MLDDELTPNQINMEWYGEVTNYCNECYETFITENPAYVVCDECWANRCTCGALREEHVAGKCLFAETMFTARGPR